MRLLLNIITGTLVIATAVIFFNLPYREFVRVLIMVSGNEISNAVACFTLLGTWFYAIKEMVEAAYIIISHICSKKSWKDCIKTSFYKLSCCQHKCRCKENTEIITDDTGTELTGTELPGTELPGTEQTAIEQGGQRK